MAVACFDSSALMKLLVEEDGSKLAEDLWNQAEVVVASRLAYPEVRAALAAARRAARLSPSTKARAVVEWDAYWADVEPIELTQAIADAAAALAGGHVLGGADAVHLAGALTFADVDLVLVTWDSRLAAAATEAGLTVAPGA